MTDLHNFRLLITSGDGPRECRLGVSLCLKVMQREAETVGLTFNVTTETGRWDNDPSSALVSLGGRGALVFIEQWAGTIQWICPSPFRKHHKRRNWFMGVFVLENHGSEAISIDQGDLVFETFRSGGPGGQHQNKTDSAVRVSHRPTGLTAQSRDERSQHRNKQVAVRRLEDQVLFLHIQEEARSKSKQNATHKQLVRGNPLRVFVGSKFQEKS